MRVNTVRWCFVPLLTSGLMALSTIFHAATEGVSSMADSSISGHACEGGNAIADLELSLVSYDDVSNPKRVAGTKTDSNGRFRFDAVAPGDYQIRPESDIYIIPGNWVGFPVRTIAIESGQSVAGADLQLIRGAVITGEVTNAEGIPLTGQFVQLDRLDDNNSVVVVDFAGRGRYLTDDRGIFRAFGLPPGRYRVSSGSGQGSLSPDTQSKRYPRTFHPDTTEASSATLIEITGPTEMRNVNIRMAPIVEVFAISGRAVDEVTGEAIDDVDVAFGAVDATGQVPKTIGHQPVLRDGQFRFVGLRPGRYAIYLGSGYAGQTNYSSYAQLSYVEVVDESVSNVEVRVRRGTGIISGSVEVDGPSDPSITAMLQRQRIALWVQPAVPRTGFMPLELNLGPDLTFRKEGLVPGRLTLNNLYEVGRRNGLTLVRILRDGRDVRGGIDLQAGEQVTGLRLVFGYGKGSIRGRVILAGDIPANTTVVFDIFVTRQGESQSVANGDREPTDMNGNFAIDGLIDGQYEVLAAPRVYGPTEIARRIPTGKASVSVVNGRVSETTIRIELSQ